MDGVAAGEHAANINMIKNTKLVRFIIKKPDPNKRFASSLWTTILTQLLRVGTVHSRAAHFHKDLAELSRFQVIEAMLARSRVIKFERR